MTKRKDFHHIWADPRMHDDGDGQYTKTPTAFTKSKDQLRRLELEEKKRAKGK